LIDDALRINAATLARRNFQVIREYQKNLPEIFLVKHKTLEILVNLIRNATQACDESGHTEKRLHIHVTSDQKKIQVEITDNGSGIPAGNLSRLFHLGFSTKKQGHGFGLHRAAVAAKELGGTLSAQSEGPGKGATFKLELPKESCLNNTNVIGDFAEAGAN
jgi:signal transduction histidine kinase